jgi:hypothetical protein
MALNKYFIKDKNGEPSVTLSAFVLGFTVASLKLLFSGMTIGDFTIEQFSGGDFAATVSALGGVYVLRRNFGSPGEKKEDK